MVMHDAAVSRHGNIKPMWQPCLSGWQKLEISPDTVLRGVLRPLSSPFGRGMYPVQHNYGSADEGEAGVEEYYEIPVLLPLPMEKHQKMTSQGVHLCWNATESFPCCWLAGHTDGSCWKRNLCCQIWKVKEGWNTLDLLSHAI